jgi:hypothetical protein
MLLETSMAKIIVAFEAGTVTGETGRLTAMIKLDIASRNKTKGI